MRKLLRSLLLLLCSLQVSLINAQPSNTDSLRAVVSGNASAKEKMKAYTALSSSYMGVVKDFDECLTNALAGAALAEKLGEYSYLGELQTTVGIAWYFKGKYDSAASYYYKALEVLKKVNDPLKKSGGVE